mgnify:CR=1 FL=1
MMAGAIYSWLKATCSILSRKTNPDLKYKQTPLLMLNTGKGFAKRVGYRRDRLPVRTGRARAQRLAI